MAAGVSDMLRDMEWSLRVARRMPRTIRSDGNLAGPDFWLISTPEAP